MNSKVFELNKLLSELDGRGGYFIDFVSTRGIQADIIRLHPGENDTQEPHSVDVRSIMLFKAMVLSN